MNDPLPLETVARVRAELDAGLPKEKVLAEVGLTNESWSTGEAAFLLKIAAEAARGRFDESRRFVSAMDEARRAAAEKIRENRKLDIPEKPVVLPPAAVALPIPPLPEITKTPEIKPPPDIPPESAAPITAPVALQAANKAPLPFTQPAEPPRAPVPRASPSFIQGTTALPAFTEDNAPDSDGLPFQKAAPKQKHETIAMPAFTEESAPDSDGLPFVQSKTPSHPPPVPPRVAPPNSLDDDPLARTNILDPSMKASVALPFGQRESQPPPPPKDDDPLAKTTVGSPNQPPKEALPFQRTTAKTSPPAAPSPEARAKAESVTLAVYARLCADVRKYPQHVSQIRAHYGFDDATWTAVHLIWRERFERDSSLRERWLALIQQHLGKA